MKRLLVFCVALLALFVSVPCGAETQKSPRGGFRELLEIAGIAPQTLAALPETDFSDEDWEILSQVLGRLQQQNQKDLARWTLRDATLSEDQVGGLVEMSGLLDKVGPVSLPPAIAKRFDTKEIYRCHVKVQKDKEFIVLSLNIPKPWYVSKSISEPIAFRGVLLGTQAMPLFLTTHLSWFPEQGVPNGQLLLTKYGMDASLWEEIVQRSKFVSPEKGREAEAFYSCLAALKKVPYIELKQLTDDSIAHSEVASGTPQTKIQRQLAFSVAKQAEEGFSSFPALFLEPRQHVGELVRFEGVARRAVRIAVNEHDTMVSNDPIREYFELEVFTADSKDFPLVCCVMNLPADFPMGDEIRTGVRIEGVFFKSWYYRLRKIVDGLGETETQEQRYTPVVLAATLTWLQEKPAETGWWGLAAGIAIFAAMVFGLVRMATSLKHSRPGLLPEKAPDFRNLEEGRE